MAEEKGAEEKVEEKKVEEMNVAQNNDRREVLEQVFLIVGLCVFSLAFFAGLSLAVVSVSPSPCGRYHTIGARAQSVCNATPEDGFFGVSVRVQYGTSSDFVTYIYTTEPQMKNTSEYIEFRLSGDDSYSLYVPNVLGTSLHYYLKVDQLVDVKFSEPSGDTLYLKQGVKTFEDSFVINEFWGGACFTIKGKDDFSGKFTLNATFPHYDLKSVKYVEKCEVYPCKWDFVEDERFKDKNIWVISKNLGRGFEYAYVSADFSQKVMLFVYIGVPVCIAGVIGFVVSIVIAHFCCISC